MAAFLCWVLIYDGGNHIMGANIDLFMHFLQVIEIKEQWCVHKLPCNVWAALYTHSP